MIRKPKKAKNTPGMRKPVAMKPGKVIDGRGYDRKKERERLRKEIEEDEKPK